MARGSIFGKHRVCAVVAAGTADEMMRQLRRARRYTRTIELRLDWLKSDLEFYGFIASLKRSDPRGTLIATCRSRSVGGKFREGTAAQVVWIEMAIAAGCKWFDYEVESASETPPHVLKRLAESANGLLSLHYFEGTPTEKDLIRLQRGMVRSAKKIRFRATKIATHCGSLLESLHLLRLAGGMRNAVVVPMGEIAAPARVLALRAGSALAYAPVETETAPGQISLDEMKHLYRADRLDRRTGVYGVIGDPICHSLSPHLHNAGFRARCVNAVYLPFLVKDLKDFVASIEAIGIKGFSVTLPHKQEIMRHLEGCDPLAIAIGAVNTVVVRGGGKLFGYNTDYVGVIRTLERRIPLAGSRVLILGAGGAARAVAFALVQGGSSVVICARHPKAAQKLARSVRGEAIAHTRIKHEYFDAIVNATPVGMHPHTDRSPLTLRELNCRLVFDLIYRPQKTKLLRFAAKRRIEAVSGLEMFLEQGIAQWEIWMGERAPETPMRRAVLRALRNEERELAQK
jgi:3-dehydroquinate dehydratase / shikimate dehydrogenase